MNVALSFFILLSLIAALPEQVHLSLGNHDTEMIVTWSAKSEEPNSLVKYTEVKNESQEVSNFDYSSPGIWTTFFNLPKDEGKIKLYSCKAIIINLNLGGIYKYIVGSNTHGWSQVFTFRAKSKFKESGLSRVIVYGDFGIGPEIQKTLNSLTKEITRIRYDAIIHNGDFAYDFNSNNGEVGNIFMNAIQPFASRVPYMISQGNHEARDNTLHYLYRFNMPEPSNFFYSFNIGRVHFVSYSTELVFYNSKLRKAQDKFIINDLSTIDRIKYPWIVVFGHRPLYCSVDNSGIIEYKKQGPRLRCRRKDCETDAEVIRKHFEPLWNEYKVDLVIQSHVHNYERLGAIFEGKIVACKYQKFNICVKASAPIYLVTGAPGQQEWYCPNSATPANFSIFQDDKNGYSRLTAYNSSHLIWEQIRSETSTVIDWLWVIK